MRRPGLAAVALGVAAFVAGTSGCAATAAAGAPQLTQQLPTPATPAAVALTPDALAPHVVIRRTPPPPPTLPDGTRVLLPGHRLVAFYGAAGAPALGVLGTGSPDSVWPRLAGQARAYRTPTGPRVLPAYELIAFVATSGPGDHGTYSHRVPDATIAHYAAAARRHHALLLLDIQPGRGDFLTDAMTLSHWLRRPDVALALDPEWKLYGNQVPLQQVGHTTAWAVNRVSRWLNTLTAAGRLPQKLLLIHQFTKDMIRQRWLVQARLHLASVFNMDGFGSQAAKLSSYRGVAEHSQFPLGVKLFYDFDVNRFTAKQVLALHPRPAVVEYQ
ncbi:MAG: hypothetical protein QOF18_3033 [Frankiaceae bacterium]|nr:hypothetical protein [Frankiaceae bacterium]